MGWKKLNGCCTSRSLSGLYAQAERYVRERGLDLILEMRQELGRVLRGFKASADLVEPLETYVPMDRAGQQRLLGEVLSAQEKRKKKPLKTQEFTHCC